MPKLTNAVKAAIIATVNAGIAVLIFVGGVDLDEAQVAVLDVFVNAVLGLWLALSYQESPTRIPGGVLQTGEHVELMGTPNKPIAIDPPIN